jgi:ligand-binding SRPBCC domain-containing protein
MPTVSRCLSRKERAVAGVMAGRIGLNEEVTWRATHFGIPFTMTNRVTALDRPWRFVDEQVRGPFRLFHHEHVFEPRGSGTVMIDRVSVSAPLGPLGWAAERVALGGYMCRLIETRASFLKVAAERASHIAAAVRWHHRDRARQAFARSR